MHSSFGLFFFLFYEKHEKLCLRRKHDEKGIYISFLSKNYFALNQTKKLFTSLWTYLTVYSSLLNGKTYMALNISVYPQE